MNEKVKLLTDNIEKVIVGKTDSVLKIITAMLCGGHVLIEDVPGVGKTQLVSALARSVDGKYTVSSLPLTLCRPISLAFL